MQDFGLLRYVVAVALAVELQMLAQRVPDCGSLPDLGLIARNELSLYCELGMHDGCRPKARLLDEV